MPRYYELPEDPAGTIFDPSDDRFGPILAALQEGEFERALRRLSVITGYGVAIDIMPSGGTDGAVVVQIDTEFEPDGSDGPGLRVLLNDEDAYIGVPLWSGHRDMSDRDRLRRELLNRIESAAAREELERAIGWTVVCDDPTSERSATLYGYFLDPIEAMRYADKLEGDLNDPDELEGQTPWRICVQPILPVSDMDSQATEKGET